MSAPPQAPRAGWTWKKTFGVAGGGVLAITALRAVLYIALSSGSSAEAFVDDHVAKFEGGYVRTSSYEVLTQTATLSYETRDATGTFSFYLMPGEQEDEFLDDGAFQFLAGHGYLDAEKVSGSIVVPKGTYSIGMVCEALECRIPLHVEVGSARSSPAIHLTSTVHEVMAPTLLWNDEPFQLDAGEHLENNEFYGYQGGNLAIAAHSSDPIRVCLTTADDFANWTDELPYATIACGAEISTWIEPGDHALLVECLGAVECDGTLRVLFTPERG